MTVLQTGRYNEILEKRGAQASLVAWIQSLQHMYSNLSMRRVFVNSCRL